MWQLCLLLVSPALGFLNQEPPPPPLTRNDAYEEHWVNVRLNHFDASNTETFPMRFFFNPVTPLADNIVIFVGGEWAISPGWVTGGFALDLAHTSDGSLFYTEHRYYGLTRPTNDTSVSELRYLTVDQALADLAQVIHYIKSDDFQMGRYRNARVALVGCSYAGTMATWMRLTYPHLITAAFSDSGPLLAQEDFSEYLEVVGEALRSQGGQSCYDSVEQSVQAVVQLMATANGPAQLAQAFGTCSAISALPLDRATFYWAGIILPFAWLVQTALPNQVRDACSALTTPDITDPVQRLAAWVRTRPTSQPCIETRYTELVSVYTDTSYDAPVTTSRLWFYQTCVEYGWYQTTNSSRQPFGSEVPLYYFHQMCRDFFSAFQSPERLAYGIDRTNLFFGGLTLPERVVTAQGALDPWHPMGPDASHSTAISPVYFIPEISHCRMIQSLDNSETEAVHAAKFQILNDMQRLLWGVPFAGAPRVAASAVVLMTLLAVFA